ncbi:universal stress protein [Halospeciosus flavus]|uniref:Universal stress protein n=1 Tax=Halospeciosus flavus TaxID=3032283 RepID=A0ABD5Z1I0_9EURY|nr:universal stress protein [Halospeciosus flavus]
MTRFLLATDSVHTTAAACDYLQGRLAGDDEVVVVSVTGPETGRDAADAANVARVRLTDADVVIDSRDGEPGPTILSAADDHGADEIVVGTAGGEPGSERRVGSTVEHVVANADVPAVVVPSQV